MEAGPAAVSGSRHEGTSRPWWSLLGICVVTALVWVTASDISIALPTIGASMGGDNADKLQWAVNGYFLAGSLIIVTGRLGDVFGRRKMFAIGALLIVAGSVVAALAQGPPMLIAGAPPSVCAEAHVLCQLPAEFGATRAREAAQIRKRLDG